MAGNFAVEIAIKARDKASTAILGVKSKLGALGTAARTTSRRIGGLTGALTTVGGKMGRLATGALKSFAGGLAGVISKVVRLGGLLTAGLGIYGVSQALRSGISSAADFEQQLAQVRAVSGATEEQMAALRAEANKLGAETTFTATEAAQGLEELARTGFSAEQSLAAIGPVLNLAAASGMDLGRAAEISSDALKGFNLSADDTQRITDVMAAASQRANTNVERLGGALSYVGPSASAAGMSIEETVSAISALQDAGIQGQRAGTQLRAILQQLQDPSTKAATALREMGIDTSNLTSTIRGLNAAGPAASGAINQFTRESRTALRVLLNKGGDDLQEFTGYLGESEGTAAETARTMNDTLQGSVKRLGSAWDALKRRLVQPLLEPIKRNVDDLAAAFQRFTNSGGMTALRQALVNTFQRGAAAVRQFLGQFNPNQLGQMLAGWVNTFADVVGRVWNWFAWLGGKIGEFYDYLTEGNRIQRFAANIGAAFRWITGEAGKLGRALLAAINPEGKSLGEWTADAADGVYAVVRGMIDILQTLVYTLELIGKAFRGVWRVGKAAFKGLVATFRTVSGAVFSLLATLMSGIERVANFAGAIIPGIPRLGTGLSEGLRGASNANYSAAARNNQDAGEAIVGALRDFTGQSTERRGSNLPEEPPWAGETTAETPEEPDQPDPNETADAVQEGVEEGINQAENPFPPLPSIEETEQAARDGAREGAQAPISAEPTPPPEPVATPSEQGGQQGVSPGDLQRAAEQGTRDGQTNPSEIREATREGTEQANRNTTPERDDPNSTSGILLSSGSDEEEEETPGTDGANAPGGEAATPRQPTPEEQMISLLGSIQQEMAGLRQALTERDQTEPDETIPEPDTSPSGRFITMDRGAEETQQMLEQIRRAQARASEG